MLQPIPGPCPVKLSAIEPRPGLAQSTETPGPIPPGVQPFFLPCLIWAGLGPKARPMQGPNPHSATGQDMLSLKRFKVYFVDKTTLVKKHNDFVIRMPFIEGG